VKEDLYIVGNTKPKEAVDYNLLREKAIARIESLSSAHWTDYNVHDPGISIIEALCYALVDIGYRFQFDIKDILEFAKGETTPKNSFYGPDEILTIQPVTLNDYRKLFIDIPGVQNAWLIPITKGSPDFYIDEKKEELSHTVQKKSGFIKGRYNAFVELENHEEWGNLNSNALYYTLLEGSNAGSQLEIRAAFKWTKKDKLWQIGKISNIVVSAGTALAKGRYSYDLKLKIKLEGDTKEYVGKAIVSTMDKELTKGKIRNILDQQADRAAIPTWLGREQEISRILTEVAFAYHDNRNLCEDLVNVEKAKAEEVAFCFDIEADPTADLEVLEAHIWYELDKYLNPRVNFYSEDELREEGWITEEIFEGPKLDGGFIKTTELEASEMKKAVYASDVINLIMDVEGVMNLTNFSMTKYNAWGAAIEKNKKWELTISPGHKPEFSKGKSKILFFKEKVPFVTRKSETQELFEGLKLDNLRVRLSDATSTVKEVGVNKNLSQYLSVVNELPQFYGVSQDGLPNTVNTVRKNAAKQLKGYLMLFDQLLTNYLAQLNQFKNWISLDPSIDESYFSQEVMGIREGDELYVNKASYLSDLNGWLEDEEEFLTRRNGILDHLLARVNENIDHHNLGKYFENKSELSVLKEEVQDKIDFLKSYALLSYKRSSAPNILENERRGGWLDKLFSQLGISANTSIGFKPVFRTKNDGGDVVHSVQWKTRDANKTLFTANKWFSTTELAEAFNDKAFNTFAVHGGEVVKAGSKWRVEIEIEEGKMRSGLISNETLAKAFLEKWTNQTQIVSETGMIVEHILMRPESTDYAFIVDCIDLKDCAATDPYSFRLTVVLPYWPQNFRNMKYRNYIEKEIRTIMPAHIMPKICWVGWQEYIQVEDKFLAWLSARGKCPWPTILTTEANELIHALRRLTSVYPEAVLHDCEDDQDENPVILNQTKLGNF
jgi:hypothetical protein